MSHLASEQHQPHPNVKWRAGEIPQSPGEGSTDAAVGAGAPRWTTRVTQSLKRKRK